MYDGRAPNLQLQARGAINAHAESNNVTDNQLDLIAAYEKTQFNDGRVKQFAATKKDLVLPAGTTDAEKRGRLFFTDDNPANGNPVKGRCVHCHNGPMLNETSPGLQALLGLPAGSRFFTAFVSEFNEAGNPVQTYRFTNPDNTTTDVTTPDPGFALTTGAAQTANLFKIPTVWGAKFTAPYFHDNSAADFTQLLLHYQAYFRAIGFDLTDQEMSDINAFMQLL
jgi:cytochrome c peroxidase